jgi:hypothetical protein
VSQVHRFAHPVGRRPVAGLNTVSGTICQSTSPVNHSFSHSSSHRPNYCSHVQHRIEGGCEQAGEHVHRRPAQRQLRTPTPQRTFHDGSICCAGAATRARSHASAIRTARTSAESSQHQLNQPKFGCVLREAGHRLTATPKASAVAMQRLNAALAALPRNAARASAKVRVRDRLRGQLARSKPRH